MCPNLTQAGLAIASVIAGVSKPTVAMVLGGAHSIGIPIATSADKTFIAKSSSMTIHPVRRNGMIIMESFPNKGYIKQIGDVILIKL